MSGGILEVFVSYSHQDEALRQALETHLAQLHNDAAIKLWHDQLIDPGQEWEPEIWARLEAADIVLLLVSPDFLASNYCYHREMTRALERHAAGSARVVPVLLRPCDWKTSPFAKLQGLPANFKPVTDWRSRDKAYSSVAEGLRRVVGEVVEKKASQPASATSASIFSVPYVRNLFFTGRKEVLENLAEQLATRGRAALGQVAPSKLPRATRAAISGLGGIGKTQTAVEFAYRHRADYQAVFFVRAETEGELIGGFAAIAELLRLPEAKAQDQLAAAQAVRSWLSRNEGWLLILDNADTPKLLETFLPVDSRGHVLVTSRAQNFAALNVKVQRLALPPDEEALAFLRERTGRGELSAAEQAAALELARELGHLPLALEQAAAYLVATQVSLASYLASYRKRGLELLDRAEPEAGCHRDPVATTWSLNFQEVETVSPASADLLRAAAFLAPDAIPDEFFLEGGAEISAALGAGVAAGDEVAVGELAAPLLRYSLVERDPEGGTTRVHRLVQQVVRNGLGANQVAMLERVVKALRRAFPRPEFAVWPRCERLLVHLFAVMKDAKESHELAWLFNAGGSYLDQHGRYAEAEPLYLRSLAIYERSLGGDHPDVATSLNNLAILYRAQGRPSEAESLYERSLAIRETTLGGDHPDVATSLNNLALLYVAQGRRSEAEPLYERSLAIREKSLGGEHPDVAGSLSNLAIHYVARGRLPDAEPLFERSLAIRETTLGGDHPDVASSLNNLAILYVARGRRSEAEPLFVRSLAIREKSLGDSHPDVAASLGNYAKLLRATGRDSEAEEFEQRAREVRSRHEGRNRPRS